MVNQAPKDSALPLMYTRIAEWWPLLSAPADYEEEAALYAAAILDAAPGARTVLELGSGGGNNASHLKRGFEMTLVDRSPDMLAVSRRLNPGVEHVEGDMRTVRLGRLFDGVLIHDAVMYMASREDLLLAVKTAAAHVRPGGVVLLVPDCVRETFAPYTKSGGHDGPDRALRYLEWTWDPDPDDDTFVCDFAYLLRESDGHTHVLEERHVFGLFSRTVWLDALEEAGFAAREQPFDYSDAPSAVGFLGVKR